MGKIKIITVAGTRPELIRLALVIKKLNEFTDHILVHTGQNYDYELNQVLFDELNIEKPQYFLDVKADSLGETLGNIISRAEAVFKKEKPDAMLVLGDTNSAFAAVIAKRMKIPVFHIEAGNRSFDLNVPEEINRKIIDHISDVNFVYSEHARRNLLNEGYHPRQIYLCGSPMKEVLDFYESKINSSGIMAKLQIEKNNYFLASFHREENVDNKDNLNKILIFLTELAEKYGKKVIVSTHPRTKLRLEALNKDNINPSVLFLKPFGFFDYIFLQKHALCVLSDSGTISEESAICGFKAVTIRNSMERPEAMDTGSIITTGLEADRVLSAVHYTISLNKHPAPPAEYLVENSSDRIVKIILGLSGLVHRWTGINSND